MLVRRITLGYLVLALLITHIPPANSKPVKLNEFGLPKSIELITSPKLVNLPSNLIDRLEIKSNRVCSLNKGTLVLIKPGLCSYRIVSASTDLDIANLRWQKLKVLRPNSIRFDLPAEIALNQESILLQVVTNSNGRVSYRTTTPNTCQVIDGRLVLLSIGSCTILARQVAHRFDKAGTTSHALEITNNDYLSIGSERVLMDQPDLRSGFQVKFVYVVPRDRVDRKLDQTDVISSWITEGQEFLAQEINRQLPIDTTQTGYDIQYLASRYSSEELTQPPITSDCDGAAGLLAAELGIPCLNAGTSYLNRKHYVLLVDLPIFNGNYCGYARIPGSISLVAVGTEKDCSGRAVSGFSDWVVMVWLHEVIHGLGVRHVPKGDCDLMEEFGNYCNQYQIDPARNRYVGSDRFGADIAKLDIWLKP